MGMKFGKGVKINGQEVQEEVKRKIIVCKQKKCSFGKIKIDDYCAICQYKEEYLYNSEINPIFIEVKDQFIYKSCHKKEKIPLYNECPHGFKEVSMKCKACARIQIQFLNSETKTIK